jgi:hypothetical protein
MNQAQKKNKKIENLGFWENMTYLEDQDLYICCGKAPHQR